MYPVGHQLVQYNYEKKTQKIIPVNLDGDAIGCLSISFDDSSIAIGTKSAEEPDEKRAAIYLIDMYSFKRKKVFKTVDVACAKVEIFLC